MLLKAQERQDSIEHLRFLLQLKAVGLDRSNQGEVSDYNNLLKSYMDLIDPTKITERESFADNTSKDELTLGDLDSIDFSGFTAGAHIDKNFSGSIEFTTKEGE